MKVLVVVVVNENLIELHRFMYLDNTFKVNLKEGNSESLPSRVHPETDGIPKNIFI